MAPPLPSTAVPPYPATPDDAPSALDLLLRAASLIKEDPAARILGVEVATLRRWRWSGGGPAFIKLGNAVRYDPRDLAAFIEAGRRRSTSETRGAE